MTEKLNKIDLIIVRYLLKEADIAEQEYLLNWLKKDISNRHYFFAYKDTWEKSRRDLSEIAGTGESFRKLKEKMDTPADHDRIIRKKSIFLSFLRYAAAVLLIAGLGFAAYTVADQFKKKEVPVTYTEITTENGQKKEVTLPDGTKVWLNSGTTFKYSDNYAKEYREVFLSGEAFFEVTRDESRTFIVRTDNITIRVLGTRFNVNCYPDLKMVETTVISGIVSLQNDNNKEGNDIVILNKLEKGTYLKDQQKILIEKNPAAGEPVKPIGLKKITLNEEETGYISSWKDQSLSFNNETLEEMAVKLQRWFNVSIKIDDANLKSYRYKGKFDNVKSIYQVLEVVKLATPITYEYNEKTKEITIKELKK